MQDKFWSRMDRSGGDDTCWPWIGATTKGGGGLRYGLFRFNGKVCRSHRLAYEFAHGAIPDGLFVCHRCDNPKCCNPAHLFLGTAKDNSDDKVAKGRGSYLFGEMNPHVRLTSEEIQEIRMRHRMGEPITSLAKEFKSDRKNISLVVNNKRRVKG